MNSLLEIFSTIQDWVFFFANVAVFGVASRLYRRLRMRCFLLLIVAGISGILVSLSRYISVITEIPLYYISLGSSALLIVTFVLWAWATIEIMKELEIKFTEQAHRSNRLNGGAS
jgi:uncharacterized membrane protein YvlD (DUF360 family)